MNFGVPKETRPLESRVGLTPAAVTSLVRAGHQIYVEHHAGSAAGFDDQNYRQAGAHVVYTAEEAYGRANVIVKVTRPTEDEYGYFQSGQAIMSFLHLAVASPDLLITLKKHEITAIGYETIELEDGALPVLRTTSEIAGRMTPIIAGDLLGSFKGGRGILLSGVPGTPPAAVVIIGAGVLGLNAARTFHNLGAQVTILDHDINSLQRVDEIFQGRIATMFAHSHNIAKTVAFADVLVTAATVPGGKAPTLITRDMLESMRQRAVLIDMAINSGGNAETSHPTHLAAPTFTEAEIIHYCVPNVPSRVARTASYALSNATLPYLMQIGQHGLEKAAEQIPDLKAGINTIKGKLVHRAIAAAIGTTNKDLSS